jgi:hypothetical protein
MAGHSCEASGSVSVVASETSGVLRTQDQRLDIRLHGNGVPARRFAAEEPDGQ